MAICSPSPPPPPPRAGLAEALQLQVEALGDRLHVAAMLPGPAALPLLEGGGSWGQQQAAGEVEALRYQVRTTRLACAVCVLVWGWGWCGGEASLFVSSSKYF